MKKKALIFLCYILTAALAILLLMVFALPFLYWTGAPSTSLNVWIVDKTVPNKDYREHKGLMWVLNSKKIVWEKTGEPFRYDTDYYGFFPDSKEKYTIKEIPKTVEKPDLIYLADIYGVYEDDYLSINSEGTRSNLIYGGWSKEELNSIKANLGGNTIIGEFNTASSPTNIANRDPLSEIFRVSWSGWSGRYFKELTKGIEVATWTVQNYEKQSGESWNFSGEGFVLVSDDDRVIVLEKNTDIGNRNLFLSFEGAYADEFGINGNIPYDYWFEFTKPDDSTEILAYYTLDTTAEGKAKLDSLGLASTFPAIIRSANSQYTSYYFAGDFADSNQSENLWNYSGYAEIRRIFTLGAEGDNSKFYWKCYVPMMSKIIEDIKINQSAGQNTGKPENKLQYTARTSGTGFQILSNNQWVDFFSKGVNIGSSTPGKWFTEFSHDESMYLAWFEQIAAMNANTIRVYTLQSPQFYNALEYFNRKHPASLLWLYQEIWPEENPANGDYLESTYNAAYQNEIKNVIDAIHGQANIPERTGRAYGLYTSDVSAYIAGYLVGRELEPEEVVSTNKINAGFGYSGDYLYSENTASPTESWLAMSCDFVLSYENEKYDWQHPVGIVSWPTLDPVEHDSEWNASGDKSLEYNDKVSIDINHISVNSTLKTGFFGAYHIYPNYPDFMNNEASYSNYTDAQGSFRYGGYLQEFIAGHRKYPALVAEFGLATGMGNAHSNPDGYNHGGLTEEQQGDGIVRMMTAIQKEGYAGGLIFEWADEWAKKTWITEPYIIPFDRNVMWHNAIDPEQNYGILAVESKGLKSEPYAVDGSGEIKQIRLSADETYLTVGIDFKREIDFSKEKLIIGLDTYGRTKGDFRYSPDILTMAPSGFEFIVDFTGKTDAQLLAYPGYNVTNGRYASFLSFLGVYEKLNTLINSERVTADGTRTKAIYQDESKLNYGTLVENSHNNWMIEGNHLQVRIPWTRINFTDPSTLRVLDDTRIISSPTTNELNTVLSDGIVVSGLIYDIEKKITVDTLSTSAADVFKWADWDMPAYQERQKTSYSIIRDYFKNIRGEK